MAALLNPRPCYTTAGQLFGFERCKWLAFGPCPDPDCQDGWTWAATSDSGDVASEPCRTCDGLGWVALPESAGDPIRCRACDQPIERCNDPSDFPICDACCEFAVNRWGYQSREWVRLGMEFLPEALGLLRDLRGGEVARP